MYTVRVRDHTMIAHSLPDPFFGPAANLHGATFVVDAELRTRHLNSVNVVIDIGVAQECLRKVLKTMDFRNLDGEACFAGQLTTTEFLAKYIHDELPGKAGFASQVAKVHGLQDLSSTLLRLLPISKPQSQPCGIRRRGRGNAPWLSASALSGRLWRDSFARFPARNC